MVRQIMKIVGILFVMTAIAIPVNAQMREDPQSAVQMEEQAEAQQNGVAEHQIAGTVIGEKTVEVKGQDVEHQVVLLQTEAGDRVIADLGPTENLQEMDFQHGRPLALTGTVARVSDRPVILARQVSADGRAIEIERPELAGPAVEPKALDFSKSLEITGEIVAEKTVEVEDVTGKNKVVLLELERGDNIVADLGPEAGLDMELARGEQVRVQGRLSQVGDRLVLLADRVSTPDKSAEINRMFLE